VVEFSILFTTDFTENTDVLKTGFIRAYPV